MGYAQDADQIVFINKVKKALYKQKPIANRVSETDFIHQYQCSIVVNNNVFICKFSVPTSDMGETVFTNGMHAQLLIRYLDIL